MFLTRKPILAMNFLETAQAGSPCFRHARGDLLSQSSQNFRAGASVIFLGVVRNHSDARRVFYLEYEAYESMAEPMMEELVREAHARWPLEEIKIAHRVGRVDLGEIAVAIQVNSAHRDEAYQASRFFIEEIKHQVPIWKKEYFEDGTNAWSLCGDMAHSC